MNREEERSDDDKDADYDGDEGFDVGGEGQPRWKKVLRLLRPVATRWNYMEYLIKRALALKDSLVMFTNLERACNGESPPTSPVDDNVEVFSWSHSHTTVLVHPSNAQKLRPCSSPTNTQNQLGILAELRGSRRMHGSHEAVELIVGILYRAHDTQHVGLFLKACV